MTEETLEERTVRALRRDTELTAAEKAAVFLDPWWATVPRADRLAWWMRWTHLEWAHTAGFDTWDAFLAALEEERLAKLEDGVYDRPPAEVTTRDPRPADAPADPPAIARLAKAADAGWEVRVGYCRGYRKVGRGNVGTSADARWALHHVVLLEARPHGVQTRAWVQVVYSALVAEKLSWKHDGSMVPGKWKATAAEAKALLEAAPVLPDTLSATRQTVADTTDMFAAC